MCETTRESEKTAMGNAEAHRRLGERGREGERGKSFRTLLHAAPRNTHSPVPKQKNKIKSRL